MLVDGEQPAPAFTDARMLGLDGLAFLDHLKAKQPELPVVVMSAYTIIASTAGTFSAGSGRCSPHVAMRRRAGCCTSYPPPLLSSLATLVLPPGLIFGPPATRANASSSSSTSWGVCGLIWEFVMAGSYGLPGRVNQPTSAGSPYYTRSRARVLGH